MKAIDIRNKFLNFFENNNHRIISGARLVPENDPTVLFTTAGMQPLVPYLLGENHPEGTRLADYQKCLRTDDIDEVGDSTHLTFFEMLGNWSLGDYFKKESITMSFEFLTKHLNIPVERLAVTCFAGDSDALKDTESAKIWEDLGIPKNKIFYLGKKDNWWGPAGITGPCGPDTEIFYDTKKEGTSELNTPDDDSGKYVEIWNNVFMEYYKKEDGSFEPLKQKNVDTGLGLERATYLLQGKNNVYETEIFLPIISKIKEYAKKDLIDSQRIVADHLRASSLLIADNIRPSNVEQGYILRRLLRRAIRHLRKLEVDINNLKDIAECVIDTLTPMYNELKENKEEIIAQIIKEKNRFIDTLAKGEKEFSKHIRNLDENIKVIDAKSLFRLYDTFGFPPEVTKELASESGYTVDMEGFNLLFKEHQELSRKGAEGKFKGGLQDSSEETTKYHTATHLLNAALRKVLGEHVYQKGSNITAERLRFDFSNPEKVSPEDLKKVEDIVNEQIVRKLEVSFEEMTVEEAKKNGAIGVFDDKYSSKVKVYSIGDFSKEICGGPHVKNTSELGKFKIKKEEAVSSGVRRIKAIFE